MKYGTFRCDTFEVQDGLNKSFLETKVAIRSYKSVVTES